MYGLLFGDGFRGSTYDLSKDFLFSESKDHLSYNGSSLLSCINIFNLLLCHL